MRERRTLRHGDWSFRIDVLDDCAHLYIPTVGWGGAAVADQAQDRWVVHEIESLAGVAATWIGTWTLTLEALPEVERKLCGLDREG